MIKQNDAPFFFCVFAVFVTKNGWLQCSVGYQGTVLLPSVAQFLDVKSRNLLYHTYHVHHIHLFKMRNKIS